MEHLIHDISFAPACKERLTQLAANLRPEDAAEARAAYGADERTVLWECVRQSVFSRVVLHRGRPAAAFGVSPVSLAGQTACIWLLTGKELPLFAKTFWKCSKRAVAYFKTRYPRLYCAVDVRYKTAERYVRRLGFYPQGAPERLKGSETVFQYYYLP